MHRHLALGSLLCALAAGGCRSRGAPARPASDDAPRSAQRAMLMSEKNVPAPTPRPLVHCFPGDVSGQTARTLEALLDRAASRYDTGDYAASLTCAEEAARQEPRSVEAHHDRAAALQELGRLDEARAAFTRALALDPDDAETLAGAAELYINHLPPSNDTTETGLEYARRGGKKARPQDKALAARLALLEGQALNDLGHPREGIARLDAALAAAPDDQRVRYERGVALFEMCRFTEARRAFADVVERSADDAWAHHQLGLVLERLGDAAGAEREEARARALAPSDFPAPVLLGEREFRGAVDAEVAHLAPELRADLAQVHLETADLPDLADLVAEDPPLSPTILGLFRGSPLGDPHAEPGEQRAIVLYRKNLGRAVTSRDELVAQIRTTLLHELGHLRGEDDEELRARGLE